MLTAAEAAARLGLSVRAVYDWAKIGDLPCVRRGRRVYFDPVALAMHMERCRCDQPRVQVKKAPAKPSFDQMAQAINAIGRKRP